MWACTCGSADNEGNSCKKCGLGMPKESAEAETSNSNDDDDIDLMSRITSFADWYNEQNGDTGRFVKRNGPKFGRCKSDGCKKNAQSGGLPGLCFAHGGGRRCSVEGCSTGARVRGLPEAW